jgi:GTP cyclohydrolase subunit MoaC
MELTHFDENGNARMVDVSEKKITMRKAVASGVIRMSPETYAKIHDGKVKKGDLFSLSEVAGIMAAKRTDELIPLCHPLRIGSVNVLFEKDEKNSLIKVICEVTGEDKSGFEMEALTGVSTALLTIYDMCKAVDKSMVICDIRLDHKSGGKSGEYNRDKC